MTALLALIEHREKRAEARLAPPPHGRVQGIEIPVAAAEKNRDNLQLGTVRGQQRRLAIALAFMPDELRATRALADVDPQKVMAGYEVAATEIAGALEDAAGS